MSAETAAESRKKLDDYILKDDKAYLIIALSIEPDLQIHVSSKTNARDAWDSLREHFQFVCVTTIVRLYKRFYGARLDEKGDLMKHITEMTTMAEQLKEMKEEVPSQKFCFVILGSLPDSYDTFITSLNARSADSIDWSNIKTLLIEEYMKRKEREKQKVDEEALFTRSYDNVHRGGYDQSLRGRGRSRGGGPGFSRRGGGRSNFHPYSGNNRFKTCFNCNETGHIASNCPRNNQNEEASLALENYLENDIALITIHNDCVDTRW